MTKTWRASRPDPRRSASSAGVSDPGGDGHSGDGSTGSADEETTVITPADPFRAAVRTAFRDRLGPASGAGAGLALGAVTLLAGHSAIAAAVTGSAIGLGAYLTYLAGGVIWTLRAGRGAAGSQPPSPAR